MRAPYRSRVSRSRPSWSVPSQWAVLELISRSRRLVCAKPYGVTTSARTAPASITTTMTPPTVPSGFRRSIWTQTSRYHGRVRAGRPMGRAIATASPEPPETGGRGLLVPDPGVEEGIREVDGEVQADDERRDDEVHGLHDRIVEARE